MFRGQNTVSESTDLWRRTTACAGWESGHLCQWSHEDLTSYPETGAHHKDFLQSSAAPGGLYSWRCSSQVSKGICGNAGTHPGLQEPSRARLLTETQQPKVSEQLYYKQSTNLLDDHIKPFVTRKETACA